MQQQGKPVIDLEQDGVSIRYNGQVIACGIGPDSASLEEKKRIASLFSASQNLLDAAVVAEDFISGFEGDETQEGIDEKLRQLRGAIAKANGQVPVTRPPIDPDDARRFVAIWTSDYSGDPTTSIIGIKWFCEERGYDFDDITAIEALVVGDAWFSNQYGNAHQVIRFV